MMVLLVLVLVLVLGGFHAADGLKAAPSTTHRRHINCLHQKARASRTTRDNALPTTSTSTALHAAAGPLVASALTVAGVIAFHEAGHFYAAKLQGMKVQSFNLGYGPKLLAWNDTAGVEFALRAFPLGGYVAFPANYIYDEETGEELEEITDPDLLQNRPPLQRAFVIAGGVLANFLLAFLLATGTASTSGLGQPIFNDGVVVTSSAGPDAPALAGGVRVSDVIKTINGQPIRGGEGVVNTFIKEIRNHPDEPVVLGVVRGPGATQVRLWPAWKCLDHPCIGSHPGTSDGVVWVHVVGGD